jgi:uncharacterized membrane protein (UPF0127 family)
MSKSWTLEVQKHPDGDFFIELNEEILRESGFEVGDVVKWVDNKDGSFSVIKNEK